MIDIKGKRNYSALNHLSQLKSESDTFTTVSQAYANTLKKIATNQMLTTEEIDDLSSKKAISQVQLFTVVQARNSLLRIYKLTEFLDKFSDKFMSDAITWQSNLAPGAIPTKTYESIFSTIMSLLNYSHSVVSNLLNDNRLNSVIIDNSINVYSKDTAEINVNSNTLNVLESTASRDRVRALLSKVISDINKVEGVPELSPEDNYVLPTKSSEDEDDEEDDEEEPSSK